MVEVPVEKNIKQLGLMTFPSNHLLYAVKPEKRRRAIEPWWAGSLGNCISETFMVLGKQNLYLQNAVKNGIMVCLNFELYLLINLVVV